MSLLICTMVMMAVAVLVPYLCFKNSEKQSVVERDVDWPIPSNWNQMTA